LPDAPAHVAIGKASTCRPGKDITIATYGAPVATCLAAAHALAEEGTDAEVIDLRSIQPWDAVTVTESVNRTGRCVVVHEAVTPFGVGAEIAAVVSEHCFARLKAPVVRVGAEFMPIPFAKSLERECLPRAEEVAAAARRVVSWKENAK
jgi:pyruvate/2-oxoglutarate/acetoin dehydrogenase E1 component